MKLSEELKWRGFINQTTLTDFSLIDDKKLTFYHGFDASADSQTVGNLAAMMLDKVFIRHGHKAILLAGGATSLIGDPGGKDAERPMQDEATIKHNVEMAEKQLKLVFDDDEFTLVNNLDWTKSLTVLEFLRDIGKHFGMSTLVQRDYIAQRIGKDGSGMSYTEFSYTLLQGYDYLYLYDNFGCTLQLSGSDQWGNILSGVDLIRKMRGAEVHAFTMPLIINKSTGKKFGKSEEGAVWLDENKTSVYKFYQFWLNLDDEGVGEYLKIYTTIEKDEYDQLMSNFESDRASRLAQKYLAYQVTKLVHGEKRAESVKNVSEVLFGQKDFAELSKDDLKELASEIETAEAKDIISAMVGSNLATSNSEARRFVESGAMSINGEKVSLETDLTALNANHGHLLIRRGKNTFALVKII
jgi:tyrosyl-tRNA synthetase